MVLLVPIHSHLTPLLLGLWQGRTSRRGSFLCQVSRSFVFHLREGRREEEERPLQHSLATTGKWLTDAFPSTRRKHFHHFAVAQQHHQLVPSFQQWRLPSQASNSTIKIRRVLGSEHTVCPRYITPTWSRTVLAHISPLLLPVPSIYFLLHSPPLPGPACFWTSTWHWVYAPFSLPTLASAIREARFLTNTHRKSNWEVKARSGKKSASVSHNTTTWSLSSSDILEPERKINSELTSGLHVVFLWSFLLSINRHIYILINSATVGLQAYVHWKIFKWIWPQIGVNKNPHYLRDFSIFSEVNAEYIMCRAGMYLF